MFLILKQTGGYGADREKLKCEIQLGPFEELEISEDTISFTIDGKQETLTGYEECGQPNAKHYPPNWVYKGKSYNRVIIKPSGVNFSI